MRNRKRGIWRSLHIAARRTAGAKALPEEMMGLWPDKPDSRDKVKQMPAMDADTAVELTQQWSPAPFIRDQGRTNRCVGFTGATGLELYTRRLGNSQRPLRISANEVYYQCRPFPDQDTGAYLRDLMKAMHRKGAVAEEAWEDQEDTLVRPSRVDAYWRFHTLGYERIVTGRADTMETCRRVLSVEKLPLFIGAYMYRKSSDAATFGNGLFRVPGRHDVYTGAHAMLITGWSRRDDGGTRFTLMNSWGSRSGDNGFFYMDEEYFQDGRVPDIWTLCLESP